MLRVLLYVLPVAALLYGLLDLRRSEAYEREGLPVWGWLLVLLIPVIGPVVWVVVSTQRRREGRADRRRPGGGPRPGGPGRRGRFGGPGPSPDDDPDFLWRLEQERRRGTRGTRGTDQEPDPDGPGEN